MRPQWVIYKNEQRIGQGISWHKSLDVLVRQEKLNYFSIDFFSRIVFIHNADKSQSYKIVKEQ